jgi:general secretion pathway protein K
MKNKVKETLSLLIPFMVRQAHHERNQQFTVNPVCFGYANERSVERLEQCFFRFASKQAGEAYKIPFALSLSKDGRNFAIANQHGVALITVLLVLAIASVAVVSMSTARQADIRRTDNQLLATQRWELVLALEQQAKALLTQDAKSNNYDSIDDNWNKRSLQSSAAAMTATANIEDLQGRINLNNLFRDGELSSDDVSRLRRLLTTLKLKPQLLDAIIDWTDTDMEIRYPHGAEDETYTRRKPPYRAANRPFADVSELLLVEGIDREIYDSLRPFIYVAEGYAPLNINTAALGVLRCLADEISVDQAASMFRAAGKPFKKIEDFLKDEAVAELKIGKYGLSVGSEHFQLTGNIEAVASQFRFVSQLRRDNGQVMVAKRQRLGAADNG